MALLRLWLVTSLCTSVVAMLASSILLRSLPRPVGSVVPRILQAGVTSAGTDSWFPLGSQMTNQTLDHKVMGVSLIQILLDWAFPMTQMTLSTLSIRVLAIFITFALAFAALSWVRWNGRRAPNLAHAVRRLELDWEDTVVEGIALQDASQLRETGRLGPYWYRLVQRAKSEFTTVACDTPAQREVVRRSMSRWATEEGVRWSHIARSLDRAVVVAFTPSSDEIDARRWDCSSTAADARAAFAAPAFL